MNKLLQKIRRVSKAFVALLVSGCMGLSPISVSAQTAASLCTPKGYTVGFFNGVWNTNTQTGAISGREAIHALIGDTYNNERVEYQLFYNNTGSTAGATGAQDVAEVFIQRALEFDASGELGRRFEYFWEAAGDGSRPFFDRLWATYVAEYQIIEGFYTSVITKAMAGWSLLLSNPPTAVDYADHRLKLDTLAAEGEKLLLVAHSQGNLFVNPAFDYVAPKIGRTSVAAVHIAPASITMRGEYLLADIDIVINGLRVQGLASVPAANIGLPYSTSDLSGHTLVGTYLDPTRAARGQVLTMSTTALSGLVTPNAIARTGFFTATLTWNGSGDVDLHTFEPDGSHVYYSQLSGVSGVLDVDNTVALGPEHYYASCDASRLATGNYRIGINNFRGGGATQATMQISFAQGGQALTKIVNLGPVRGSSGNSTPITMFNVTVTKDSDGRFSATAAAVN